MVLSVLCNNGIASRGRAYSSYQEKECGGGGGGV